MIDKVSMELEAEEDGMYFDSHPQEMNRSEVIVYHISGEHPNMSKA